MLSRVFKKVLEIPIVVKVSGVPVVIFPMLVIRKTILLTCRILTAWVVAWFSVNTYTDFHDKIRRLGNFRSVRKTQLEEIICDIYFME